MDAKYTGLKKQYYIILYVSLKYLLIAYLDLKPSSSFQPGVYDTYSHSWL